MNFLYSLRKIHGCIHEFWLSIKKYWIEYRTYIHPLKKALKKHPNIAILALTPDHGNIGDHAIAYAETELLSRIRFPYIEISGHLFRIILKHNACRMFNGHPILITGGGNLGTLWLGAESQTRIIIQKNPDSCIMILPNTIFYEDSDFGRTELQKSIKIYNSHKNLHIFVRERISYESMKDVYQNLFLMPDMVLSLNAAYPSETRNGCLLCLRSDKERTRTEDEDAIISHHCSTLFGSNIKRTDMVERSLIPIAERNTAIKMKFSEFRHSELVVTDRLHGMIFCAVTGTPCIAIESKSHKLRGCYNEWLKNLPYIALIKDLNDIPVAYSQLGKPQSEPSLSHLSAAFHDLEKFIISTINKEV